MHHNTQVKWSIIYCFFVLQVYLVYQSLCYVESVGTHSYVCRSTLYLMFEKCKVSYGILSLALSSTGESDRYANHTSSSLITENHQHTDVRASQDFRLCQNTMYICNVWTLKVTCNSLLFTKFLMIM